MLFLLSTRKIRFRHSSSQCLTGKPHISVCSALMNMKQCHISGITKKKYCNEVKAKWRTCPVGELAPVSPTTIDHISFIANTPLQSRTRLATLMGAMCSTSQCELRSTFPNLRVTNVIRIVTFYTLPPLESPTSSWMTRSQRSRRRDKGLLRVLWNM